MDPTTIFCPNLAGPARGQSGQGTISIHARKEQRFLCTVGHKTFSATKGTALYRLRTPAETVSLVVTLLAHGCPLQAIVVAFGYDERTVACWLARAGRQGQAVQEHLVEHPHDLGQVQADAIRVKKQGGIVWMALALMVSTRLWLGGEVSAQRDMALIRRLITRVKRCAAHGPLLICTDGLVSSIRAVRETFRDAVYTGQGGRPRLRPELHRGAFAMKDRAVSFVEVSVAGDTLQLPPGTATGMPIGAEVAASAPAMVGTVWSWTAVRLGVDNPLASAGEANEGR